MLDAPSFGCATPVMIAAQAALALLKGFLAAHGKLHVLDAADLAAIDIRAIIRLLLQQ